MKRKVVNPNPQEKKIRKLEEKVYETEMKEEEIVVEEIWEQEKEKKINENTKKKNM